MQSDKNGKRIKINIEGQVLCIEPRWVRGIAQYTINLISSLCTRSENEYYISFFDYNKERGNRKYLLENIGNSIRTDNILECNSLHYGKIIDDLKIQSYAIFKKNTYDSYFKQKFDIYHFPMSVMFSPIYEKNVVVTVHDIMPIMPKYEKYWPVKTREVFRGALEFIKKQKNIFVVADSWSTKNDLINIANIEDNRIDVVHLAIDENEVYYERDNNALERIGIYAPYLLYIGAIDYRKGIIDILTAYQIIREEGIYVKLVLTGNIEISFKKVFEEALEKNKYKKDILLTGYVSSENKRKLLSGAEIFLFPSEYEGFGLPVLEAMTCAAPVITTKISSIPEVAGDAVVYIESGNIEELVSAIKDLVFNNEKKEYYRELGLAQSKNFSWSKIAENMELIYRKVYERN